MKEEASTCAFKNESHFKVWRGQHGERSGVEFEDLGVTK